MLASWQLHGFHSSCHSFIANAEALVGDDAPPTGGRRVVPAAGGGTTRRTEVAAAGSEIRWPRVARLQAHGDDSQQALGKFDFFFFSL